MQNANYFRMMECKIFSYIQNAEFIVLTKASRGSFELFFGHLRTNSKMENSHFFC